MPRDHHRSDRLRLGLRYIKRNDFAAAVAKKECGLLANSVQHLDCVPILLADLKILRIVHRTAGIGAAVVDDDFVFIRQNMSYGCLIFSIPAGSRDHQ